MRRSSSGSAASDSSAGPTTAEAASGVPSVDGISHNEAEFTRDEDLVAGVAVLTEVVERLAAGDLAD
ncbi:hypothetical protein [Sinomonas sp. ASV322]|uniref:hypothetical protein n=1 Tax=Sinomonas sp. ASV322 TaxID=3041920 RepID=UPI0027DC9976|nr:hypothetical protein [Sinomonas sp. ASV322]MDQ4503435.1 hypothetical protein [Sinomonas sp. ASV322]